MAIVIIIISLMALLYKMVFLVYPLGIGKGLPPLAIRLYRILLRMIPVIKPLAMLISACTAISIAFSLFYYT